MLFSIFFIHYYIVNVLLWVMTLESSSLIPTLEDGTTHPPPPVSTPGSKSLSEETVQIRRCPHWTGYPSICSFSIVKGEAGLWDHRGSSRLSQASSFGKYHLHNYNVASTRWGVCLHLFVSSAQNSAWHIGGPAHNEQRNEWTRTLLPWKWGINFLLYSLNVNNKNISKIPSQ